MDFESKGNMLKKLIQNNTGVSSKNFFLVAVTIIGFILLLVPAIVLIIEVIANHTISTNLNDMADIQALLQEYLHQQVLLKLGQKSMKIKELKILIVILSKKVKSYSFKRYDCNRIER